MRDVRIFLMDPRRRVAAHVVDVSVRVDDVREFRSLGFDQFEESLDVPTYVNTHLAKKMYNVMIAALFYIA